MKNSVAGPVAVGAVIAILVAIAVVGVRYFSGGKQGEKPKLDPQVNRMYSRPQPGGASPGSPGR